MYNPHSGFQQGQWHHQQQQQPHQALGHGSHRSGPPPAKRAKNNPIITRYPPPPGYTGPGAQPAQYQQQQQQQQQQWQQPTQSYPGPHGQKTYSGPHGQTTYPGYAQPGFKGYVQPQQTYPHPQQAYAQPHQSYAQPHQPYPQPQYPGYPTTSFPQQPQHSQPAWSAPTSTTHSPSSAPWQPSHKSRHSSATSASIRRSADPFSENQDYVPGQANVDRYEVDDLNTAFLEEDYLDEGYSATHPDEIDPSLSLGTITWLPPLPTKRPLPPTHKEAELEAIAPRKALPSDDESISDYFIYERRHEAFLSIRQTERWNELKDDIIFREFAQGPTNVLALSELVDKYRRRHDAEWEDRASTPTPEPEDNFSNMQVDANGYEHADDDEPTDMLGNLEQALNDDAPTRQSAHHARTMSNSSATTRSLSRPRALLPVRDPAQEDLLAALGVTGSPKIVYETPGPAIGPSQPQRERSLSRPSRDNSASGMSDRRQAAHQPPPPPPPPSHPPPGSMRRSGSYDPWAADNHTFSNGRRGSNSSQHTAAGSDFSEDDGEKTPRAEMNGSQRRKRGYEESNSGSLHGIPEQDEEATPRPRRKQQRVDDVYK
ncbi:uncharacterized protein LTR77_009377 [Saxophila tyrrhenica]|uniref:Uncharacterized protein n=1 Tax=Saxophila tyrrhenica TaxID=1690608 RepID=A0AAV9NZ13_9PEZI|nr:hypothetical protein LTR77_009377 [Saxophila tyrrhenica]